MRNLNRLLHTSSASRTVAATFVLWSAGVAHAGFYLSGELGVNAGGDMRLHSGDTDRASRCDEFVNPRYAELDGCTDADRGAGAVDDWLSDFDGATGWQAGIAGGYAIGNRWRLELEFLRRRADVDQTTPILSPDGIAFTRLFGAELPEANERIGRFASSNLFANVYFDWPNDSRFTPYAGVGGGIGLASMDYAAIWRRNTDPGTVESAAGLPNEDEVRRNLAGTASVASKELRDRLRGWQLLAGIRYEISDALALSLHGRWTRFSAFSDGGAYQQLRDHISNLRRDGSEPVRYRVRTEDSGFFGLGLRLTVHF